MPYPRLLIFLPCDNVLITEGSNTASLIVVLDQIQLGATTGEMPDPLPANAAAPMRWFIYSQWFVGPEHVGVKFEQKLQMVDSQGTPLPLVGTSEFVPQAGKTVHRVIAALSFFPIVESGMYKLRAFIRQVGEEEWHEAGDYPFMVILNR